MGVCSKGWSSVPHLRHGSCDPGPEALHALHPRSAHPDHALSLPPSGDPVRFLHKDWTTR